MRIRTPDGTPGFLGYCANVHPGESLPDVLCAIEQHASAVRRALQTPALSLGLWLSRRSADELSQPAAGCAALSRALQASGIFVVTLNGFPYGNFHAEVVKRQVYHPDLCSPERREYLEKLARILAGLLPADAAEGTISTVPIGHRAEPLDLPQAADRPLSRRAAAAPREAAARQQAREAAARQLCDLVEALARLRDETGRSIRICLEPEPGCWLESSADVLQFFCDTLPVIAKHAGVSRALTEQHLGLCYDTCHQAIAFEDARESLRALQRAGIRVGKAQLSSALELPNPRDPAALERLRRFHEPRFLHQVRTRTSDGQLWAADDLDQLGELPLDHPLRVHFHVPIHRASVGNLTTTRPFLLDALTELAALRPLPHFEVETYTWTVLPEAERPKTEVALVQGLANEIAFARAALQ